MISVSILFIVFFYGLCVFSETVPVLSVPPHVIIECNTTSPTITGYPNVSGNCNLEYHDVVDPDSSIFTIFRTWTCGNANVSQTIQVADTTAPTINNPTTFLTWCNYTEGTLGENITDNCDDRQELYINYTNTPSTPNLVCSEDYAFSQKWRAVDRSGNEAVLSTRIAVEVVTAITWEYLPGPVTVVCTSGVSPNMTGMAIAFDQCYRLVPVTWQDSVSYYCNATAQYQFQRTFVAMRCGVRQSYVQTIEVLPPKTQPLPLEPPTTVPTEPRNGTLLVSPFPGPSPEPPGSIPAAGTLPACSCPNGYCFGGTECLSCRTGYFGTNCVQSCFCQNGLCDDGLNGNGYCLVCKQGYYGISCDSSCLCTNGICNDGTDGDGSCLGCSKGYYGVNCQMKCICNDDTCDDGPTGTGVCLNSLYVTQSPSPNPVAPFLVGAVILLMFLSIFFGGLVIGLLMYYRFKRVKHLYEMTIKDRNDKVEKEPLVN